MLTPISYVIAGHFSQTGELADQHRFREENHLPNGLAKEGSKLMDANSFIFLESSYIVFSAVETVDKELLLLYILGLQ